MNRRLSFFSFNHSNHLWRRHNDLILPYGHYHGDVRNGLPHGIGTLQYYEGLDYTGEWKNGKWHGIGLVKLSSGKIIEGNFNDHTYEGMLDTIVI